MRRSPGDERDCPWLFAKLQPSQQPRRTSPPARSHRPHWAPPRGTHAGAALTSPIRPSYWERGYFRFPAARSTAAECRPSLHGERGAMSAGRLSSAGHCVSARQRPTARRPAAPSSAQQRGAQQQQTARRPAAARSAQQRSAAASSAQKTELSDRS